MASARRSPQYWLAQFPVHGTRGRAMACVAIVVWAVLSRRERNVLMAHPHCPRFILLHVPFVPMPLNRAREPSPTGQIYCRFVIERAEST